MNKGRLFFIGLFGVIVMGMIFMADLPYAQGLYEDSASGQYYSLIDENNNTILQTGSKVYVGDEYISADNSHYEVTEVAEYTAYCKFKGKVVMPEIGTVTSAGFSLPDYIAVPVAVDKNDNSSNDKENGSDKPTIAVYHTHSDESYVPSDGVESEEGEGGIYDVGRVLVDELKKQGYNVEYNTDNHNPHDANAYNRSRKTAAGLIRNTQPDMIIDVHRDAVPPEQYKTEVEGQSATKVKLVVGQSNPNKETNLEFAKQLKAAMDKTEPGLSNGIYQGKGDYNQDLSPRAILIEIGAHTNNKEDAKAGAKLFAQAVPAVLDASDGTNKSDKKAESGTNKNGSPANNDTVSNAVNNNTTTTPAAKPLGGQGQSGAATVTIVVILLVVAAGLGGYYWLNKGSIKK